MLTFSLGRIYCLHLEIPCQIFGGVGIACLPLGLIASFIRRPKAVITRSQYIKVFFSFQLRMMLRY